MPLWANHIPEEKKNLRVTFPQVLGHRTLHRFISYYLVSRLLLQHQATSSDHDLELTPHYNITEHWYHK